MTIPEEIKCKDCDYFPDPTRIGWCYMFKEKPEDVCMKFKPDPEKFAKSFQIFRSKYLFNIYDRI